MNLHSIRLELTRQEKAIWGLHRINPGQYTCVIQADGTVRWTHMRGESGLLDLDYFITEYERYNPNGRYY